MINLLDIDIAENLFEIGNKSLKLAELKELEFNIPDGYVITEEELKDLPSLQIPFDNVAVRSAALGEDAYNASFAGIFKTKLNVRKENYLEALEEVNQSFYSRKSEVYQKLKKVSIKPQILVQEMIESKYSIVFLMKKKKLHFSLIKGSCEKIVSGEYNADEYSFDIKKIKSFFNKFNRQGKYPDINLEKFIEDILFLNIFIHPDDGHDLDIEATYDGEKWWVLQLRELEF
jgi:phosphoenolpyruvate synthase/pyruvate phosphate dikinase